MLAFLDFGFETVTKKRVDSQGRADGVCHSPHVSLPD